MAREVMTIPATVNSIFANPSGITKKRRVAAYARVSTDRDEQLTSYEAQVSYYTNYIKSREDWEFAGIYTDEGITGTNTKHREGFKRMVQDALDGKIDLVIAKSLSRFSRNTVDSLTTIRKLKAVGVECYFEKESIWTLDSKGEILISIMSSLAQEESRSISENTTWGQRKRFADGKVSVPFSHFLGYDRGDDGNLVINEEQAQTVRLIYKLFLSGLSYTAIGNELMKRGIKSPAGKDKWWPGPIKSILTNEKMKGDALLQKKFTVDFLTKKQVKNEGQVPQYYVTANHEPIIEPATFDLVQAEIKLTFVTAFNKLYEGKNTLLENLRLVQKEICDTTMLEEKQRKLATEMQVLVDMVQNAIGENARIAQNQAEYQKRYEELVNRYNNVKAQHNETAKSIREKRTTAEVLDAFSKTLRNRESALTEFDDGLWGTLVDYMTVYGRGDIGVTFKDGTEIRTK